MNTATFQNSATVQGRFETFNTRTHTSPIAKFMNWCEGQEEHRLLWTGIMIALHGCVLTPITVLLIAFTGVNMFLIGTAIFAMTFVLITNLSALPTKYTLPTFLFSIIVDIVLLIAAYSL